MPVLRVVQGFRELRRSERPSSTAQWTTLGRAVELWRPREQRIVNDEFAPLFLSRNSRRVAAVARRGTSLLHMAERHQFAGLSAYALCRHAYIDDRLLAAVGPADTEQVLILGAGYDSRAYRFTSQIGPRPVFEVDLPPLSRAKAALVAANADRFGHASVHRIEVDFQTDSLADRLRGSGLLPSAATFVVWEGVSPYLPEPAVRATLGVLAELCGAGSRLAMDLWDGGRGVAGRLSRLGAQAFRLVGEPVRFGIPLAAAQALLAEHGWTIADVADSRRLAGDYSTDGRAVERSLYVVTAERRPAAP